MDRHKKILIISAIMLATASINFSRLSGTECIRPIHTINLLVMGAAMGIILMQILSRIREKK